MCSDCNIEAVLEKKLERLVDGLSRTILDIHKKKLGFEGKRLSKEEYITLLGELKKSIEKFAGERIANEMYDDLMRFIENSAG